MSDHLVLRSGIYHVRIDVPDYARAHPDVKGRKVLSSSLKTGDRSKAKARSFRFLAEWRIWFLESKPEEIKFSSEEKLTPAAEPVRKKALYDGYAEPYTSSVLTKALFGKDYVGLLRNGVEGSYRPEGIEVLDPKNMFSIKMGDQFRQYLTFETTKIKTMDQKFSRWTRMAEYFGGNNIALSYSSVAFYLRNMRAAVRTKMGYISAGASFWRCLCELEPDHFEPHKSPFLNHKLARLNDFNGDMACDQPRAAFEISQVVELLESAKSEGKKDIYIVMTIAAYTGMRVEEIFGVKKLDISNGCIFITKAKNASGVRRVPIHSKIVGLINTLIETTDGDYLLSSKSKNTYGIRSDPFSKKFSRFIRAKGYGKQYVFHSIRKTVSTILQQNDIAEIISSNILGHTIRTMTYGLYSSGSSYSQMKDAIEAIEYC